MVQCMHVDFHVQGFHTGGVNQPSDKYFEKHAFILNIPRYFSHQYYLNNAM